MGLRRRLSLSARAVRLTILTLVLQLLVVVPGTALAYNPMPAEMYPPAEEELATGYIPDASPAPSIHDGSDEQLRGTNVEIPSSYDGRELGYVTSAKDQGPFGTCWAFAVTGVIESSLLCQGKADATLDLSERHLVYFTYHVTPDPLGNTTGDSTILVKRFTDDETEAKYRDLNPYLTEGGNYRLAASALASWMGAANEDEVPTYDDLVSIYRATPWEEGETTEEFYTRFLPQVALDASLSHDDAFHLTQARRIPLTDTDDIKRTIMTQGAVGFSIRFSSSCRNGENGAYYNPQKRGDGHAVVAIGWDDDYSRDNFSGTKPEADGAWICKDSHGTGVADGFLYISYEDPMLTASTAYANAFEADSADALDNIYQYDGAAGTCYNSIESGGAIANVFKVRANEGGRERLKAVSFALSDANVQYSVQVYDNPTNASNPTSGTAVLVHPVEGTTTYAGYYTIDLGEGVVFDEGDTFSVVVTLSKKNAGEDGIGYDVDCTYGALGRYGKNNKNYWYHCNASVASGQSFERDTANGTWDDLSSDTYDTDDEPACSARLKAFTVNEPLGQTIDLQDAQVGSIAKQRYTSKALKPAVTVTYGNEVLRRNRDYRVKYEDNVAVGTARVTITGIGRCYGTLATTFEIYADPEWVRLWGNTALDTMQAIVQADGVFKASTVKTVVVATASGYKDALAAAGLAGRLGAPVLITSGTSLASQTAAELRRLAPTTVIVAGGPVAVGEAVLSQIQQTVPTAVVRRVYGKTAVDTALALWRAGTGWGNTAIVATSNGYKDALSIAPYAYAKAAPIFLANPSKTASGRVLSAEVQSALAKGGFTRVVIVGGTLAVSEVVESQVGRNVEVVRLPGTNAIDTSRLVGTFELEEGMTLTHLAVATTAGYKDALCGAALAGAQNSVLVLVNKTGGFEAFDALNDRNQIVHGHILGGPAAISAASWTHITSKG